MTRESVAWRAPRVPRARRLSSAILGAFPRLLLVALMSAVLTSVPRAAGHATLLESSPAHGAHLNVVPASVRLTFTEDLTPRFILVALTVDEGAPHELESQVDGPFLTASVPSDVGAALPGAPPTSWRVDYRVVSADGHPVTGAIQFTVDTGETASTSTAVEPTTAPRVSAGAATPAPVPSHARRGTTWRWLAAAGAVVVVLAAGAVAQRRDRRRRDRGLG